MLIVCSEDIEINLGLKTKNQISFCHWDLNGLQAHNFSKVSLLQALPLTRDYDVIFLSDKFLDSSISNEDERIKIEGYNPLQVENASNKKRRDVCIICMYYKEHLPIIKRDDLRTLKEYLATETVVDKKVLLFAFV